MNLSIIIPVYNSSKILKALVKRIKKNLRTKNYEIIFINDASLDNSWNEIKKISKKNDYRNDCRCVTTRVQTATIQLAGTASESSERANKGLFTW